MIVMVHDGGSPREPLEAEKVDGPVLDPGVVHHVFGDPDGGVRVEDEWVRLNQRRCQEYGQTALDRGVGVVDENGANGRRRVNPVVH